MYPSNTFLQSLRRWQTSITLLDQIIFLESQQTKKTTKNPNLHDDDTAISAVHLYTQICL